jgi:phytoene desaturase (3,4-didehydrolycopene-forming)
MKPPSNDPDESNPAQSPSHLGPITNGETPDPPIHKPPNDPIRLQVGERSFTTTRSTLAEESAYFASLLSGRWETARADGSYFVDADPDLFVHILRYLRRGVLPVFYDVQKGHDEALYDALLKEVSFLGIAALESYLENRTYLDRVAVSSWVGLPPEPGWDNVNTVQSDVRMSFMCSGWCRRSICVLRGLASTKDRQGAVGGNAWRRRGISLMSMRRDMCRK